eukprot:scaffold1391_cov137-Pinguiococcus_pyrenoidosus.AAC.2
MELRLEGNKERKQDKEGRLEEKDETTDNRGDANGFSMVVALPTPDWPLQEDGSDDWTYGGVDSQAQSFGLGTRSVEPHIPSLEVHFGPPQELDDLAGEVYDTVKAPQMSDKASSRSKPKQASRDGEEREQWKAKSWRQHVALPRLRRVRDQRAKEPSGGQQRYQREKLDSYCRPNNYCCFGYLTERRRTPFSAEEPSGGPAEVSTRQP